jgi:carotenoid 1,2-hydratase
VTRTDGPDFAIGIPKNGYVWWYLDAISDDGGHALTIIAMIGSVFSPYYAAARRRGAGDPESHCALNIALYGRSGKKWALTERGRGALSRSTHDLAIGPSSMRWDGTDLVIEIDEITVPIPSRLRGVVRLSPSATVSETFALAETGNHRWRPIAPVSRVSVEMTSPSLSWSGAGYFDWNAGDGPLEDAFSGWHWSRASAADGTTIFYDGERRREGAFSLALAIEPNGTPRRLDPPPECALPTTPIWRIARATRSDSMAPARIVSTCEDTPFYARSVAELSVAGRRIHAMHESLSLDRFGARWVQSLLPFRMPRRGG